MMSSRPDPADLANLWRLFNEWEASVRMSELPQHITSRIAPEPNSGCWLWTGWFSGSGYGRVDCYGKRAMAHRIVYEHHHGSVPVDLELDHICRVRECVNPDHLMVVTRQENASRRQQAQTHCKNGHEFSAGNTYVDPRGWRHCKTCQKTAGKSGRIANKAKTHCFKGHEFTQDNTLVDRMGRRLCRQCRRDRERKAYAG